MSILCGPPYEAALSIALCPFIYLSVNVSVTVNMSICLFPTLCEQQHSITFYLRHLVPTVFSGFPMLGSSQTHLSWS